MQEAVFLIEVADEGDAKEILDLQKLAYLSEAEIYDDYEIPPLLQTLDEMRLCFKDHLFLKAVVGGRIVGSVRGRLEGKTCMIGRLIVHPDFQGRGVGTILINRIEEQFRKAGRFELFTGHRSERNLHIYGRLGYRVFREEAVSDRLKLLYLEKPGPKA
jgi:GNAT superfamily N-acetyltransferase